MFQITLLQQKILMFLLSHDRSQSSGIHAMLAESSENVSLVTVKRAVVDMVNSGLLRTTGAGRSTAYVITVKGRLLTNIDAKAYCAIDPDERVGQSSYNFELFSSVPEELFDEPELDKLNAATATYHQRTNTTSPVIQKKELERLVIELSWKSSKIEGNTYTLLDTEKLILENKAAPGHSKAETQMILNHKDAFTYIHKHSSQYKTLTRKNLEELHTILVKDLDVGKGLRSRAVGITGSKYLPLDTVYQITEAVDALSSAATRQKSAYSQAILALLGVSYIQPFEDGNKRVSRLAANAVLLAHKLSPLSYRSVNEKDYRESMLVFYETNSTAPFKKIFIEQYDFAARNYAVK